MLTWSKIPALTFMECSHDDLLNELMELLAFHFHIEYAVVCIESHQDGGVHFHAAVKLERRQRLALTNLIFHGQIPNVQYAPKNMDWLRIKEYVKKDGEFIEVGDDKSEVKLKYKEKLERIKTVSFSNYIENYATSLSDIRLYKETHSALVKPWSGIRRLYWFYGETGTGKTRRAWEIMKQEVEHSGFQHTSIGFSGKQFINNYHGEEVVLIDDLRKTDIELNILLKMLDRYPYVVNVKGGFVNWNAQIIIITSHFNPKDCYSYEKDSGDVVLYDNVDQLLRRLDEFGEIRCFEIDSDKSINNGFKDFMVKINEL